MSTGRSSTIESGSVEVTCYVDEALSGINVHGERRICSSASEELGPELGAGAVALGDKDVEPAVAGLALNRCGSPSGGVNVAAGVRGHARGEV